MANCPNCGTEVGEGALFCDQCGTRLPAPEEATPEAVPVPAGGSVICGACGAGNVPGEAFCDFCGSPLEPPVPSAEAVPELEPVSSEAELEVEAAPAPEAHAEPVGAPPADEAADKPVCPACKAEVQVDEAFCASCGASLAQPPIPPEAELEALVEAAEAVPEPAEPAAAEVEVAEEPVAVPELAEPAPLEEAPVVEPAPEAAPALPVAVPPVATGCPVCGAGIEAGDKFCSNCGAALAAPEPEAPAAPVADAIPPAPPAPAGPRLVVVASGAEIPLPSVAEILIGREDPVSGIFPEVDLTPHGGEEGGVSRRHARIYVDAGSYSIEDLDSTNYTFVNKQRLAPKTRQPLNSGDEIRCGRVALVLQT